MKKSILTINAFICIGIITSAFLSPDPVEWKNLKILPMTTTHHEMDSIMGLYSSSLGVDCGFCHVHTGDNWFYESDENKHKLIGREMMKMTDSINHVFFPEGSGTSQTITCYSCHHGEKFPARFEPSKPAWLK